MIDDTFVLCMELYVPNAGQLFLIYDYKKKNTRQIFVTKA